jgi:hypothetical protein
MTQKPEMVRIEKVESWKKKNWWDARQEWYSSRKLNPRKEKWMQWNLFKPKNHIIREWDNEWKCKQKKLMKNRWYGNSLDVYASLKMPSPIQEWGINGFQ